MAGSLERIYGTITFYLANKDSVEKYLRGQARLWKEVEGRQTSLPENLAEKLRRAKEEVAPRQGRRSAFSQTPISIRTS
jgi:hypothetical protein